MSKTCPLCQKDFSHPGSLGRHLDLKRGTRLHPAEAVDVLRADVKRRGDAVEVKARRARRATMYNARDDVKARTRQRRKMRERTARAQAQARLRLIARLSTPVLSPHPSFAYMVLYLLPPAQWPHDPPTKQTYHEIVDTIARLPMTQGVSARECEAYRTKLEAAFDQWRVLTLAARSQMWVREQRRAAEEALSGMTLQELGSRDRWLSRETERLIREDEEEVQETDEMQVPDFEHLALPEVHLTLPEVHSDTGEFQPMVRWVPEVHTD